MRVPSMRVARLGAVLVLAAVAIAGCSSDATDTTERSSGGGGNAAQGSTGSSITQGAGGSTFTTSTGSGAGMMGIAPPDSAYVPADQGAYALGMPITGDGVTSTGIDSSSGCNILVGVVRDFKGVNETGGHPDFEAYSGKGPTLNLVASALGTDSKPVYASQCEATLVGGSAACPYGQQTTSKMYYDEWYRYTENVNKPYLVYFKFAPNGSISTFASTGFFPLDNAGWGNSGTGTDHKQHNFGFTTELHTKFQYAGGEQFSFTGDDDLWVFINGKLAIDLGGLHPAASKTIDLDQSAAQLGIVKGNVYPLELFHAERHTNQSNFHVDTDLAFVDCGSVPPDVK